ncbi:hypothetical protein [Pelagibaculum spongiae]|uniref:Antibiotic biosynthesis monooxygenase n=1 Tax=Pelagibaculum spongiae TaxID=2080658 RepID=A0A2V1H0P7_9GAMM|nr:hypothetical protein [Pelagibaculum spongiae]PVZ69643.1 hypothetical protein DC094_10080 [Pelagibaculum spongiae]
MTCHCKVEDLDPVTVVVSYRIKSEQMDAFNLWSKKIAQVANQFPGHQGTNIIPSQAPVSKKSSREITTIFRFNNHLNLAVWEESLQRAEMLEQLQPLIDQVPVYQKYDGVDFWFDLPDHSVKRPAKYKMAILSLFAIYPQILFIPPLLDHWLQGYDRYFVVFISCICTALLMTWVAMPLMARVFDFWLYPEK